MVYFGALGPLGLGDWKCFFGKIKLIKLYTGYQNSSCWFFDTKGLKLDLGLS